MALFNTDGEYVRVNAALCAFLGRTREELIGRRDQEFTHPDDRQSDVDAAWRILRGEIHTWQCEKRFVRPDGGIVWAIANLTFLRDADGNPMTWVGQSRTSVSSVHSPGSQPKAPRRPWQAERSDGGRTRTRHRGRRRPRGRPGPRRPGPAPRSGRRARGGGRRSASAPHSCHRGTPLDGHGSCARRPAARVACSG
ncbi:MAG: PAS domain S-box protein [Actinomycetota bacterium]